MDSCPALLLKNLKKDLVEALPEMREQFGQDVVLSASTQVAAANSLLASLFKKWIPVETQNLRELAKPAIAGFLACNDVCSTWTPPDHPLYARVYEVMQRKCYDDFNDIDVSWGAIFARARMGPGASVGSSGKNSYLEKLFLNRMSTDSLPLYKEYVNTLASHPIFYAAEMRRRCIRGQSHLRLVKGSTLSTVRKNVGTDRTICAEASLNMFAQLGLGEIFNETLARVYGYSPEIQQDRNRELARRGSRSGRICTIDSTTASDLIAHMLTQRTLHPLVSCAIDDCRSTHTKVNGKYVLLHMVSSMGNGFTFPLMTYLFTVAIASLCEVLDVDFSRFDKPGTPFGVFGDDICVPTELYEPLCGFLSSIGFKPNMEKSFSTGPFRESCGGDYFNGEDVRGVYIKKLTSAEDSFSAVNRLNVWSAKHMIPLPRLVRCLLPRGWTKLVVPLDEADTAGIKTTAFGHKPTYRCLQPVVENTIIWYFRKGKIMGLKRQFDNPMGVLLMTINGSVVNGSVTRRRLVTEYTTVEKAMPNVWACDRDFGRHCVTVRDWEVLSAINLGVSR